jgi:hypothetical protein
MRYCRCLLTTAMTDRRARMAIPQMHLARCSLAAVLSSPRGRQPSIRRRRRTRPVVDMSISGQAGKSRAATRRLSDSTCAGSIRTSAPRRCNSVRLPRRAGARWPPSMTFAGAALIFATWCWHAGACACASACASLVLLSSRCGSWPPPRHDRRLLGGTSGSGLATEVVAWLQMKLRVPWARASCWG